MGSNPVSLGVKSVTTGEHKNALTQLSAIDLFAKKHGITIIAVDSLTDAEGNAINGEYRTGNNIVISLDADGGLYMPVVGHEIFHYAESINAEDAKALAELIIDTLKASKGEEWLEARRREYEGYGYKDGKIDSEIAADFFGAAVTQKDFERQIKTAELNKSFTQKIIDKVKEVVAELKEIMQKLRGQRLIYDAALDTDAETLDFFVDNLERILNQAGTENNNVSEANPDGILSENIVYAFSRSIDKSESKQVIDIVRKNIDKIKDISIFNEKSVDIRNYEKKSDYVLNVFDEQGNIAINKKIGKVELVKSGAKSTMMHGFGKAKIAAIIVIKPVIENGDIVSYVKQYDKDSDRYIIAGKGKIDGENAVVGVVVKSYLHNGVNKFYLHEAEIIKAELSSMTGSHISEDTVNNSASDPTVTQKSPSVNSILSENPKKITKFQKKLPDVQEKLKKMSGSDDIDDVKRMAYGLADDFMKYAKAARLEMTETRGLMPQSTRISEIVAKYNDYRKTGVSNKQLESDITDIFTDYMNGVGSSGTLFNYITDTIMKRELNSYEVIGDETFKAVRAYTDGGRFKVSDATVGSLVDTFGSLGEINSILRENYGFTIAKETDTRAETRAAWAPVGAQLAEEAGYVFDGTDYSYTSKYTTENGYVTSRKVYQCESCEGCPYRNECHTSKYDRRIRVSHKLTEQNQKATELITTDEGIFYSE